MRGSPAARISDKYFITPHSAVPRMVSAAHGAPLPAWTAGGGRVGCGVRSGVHTASSFLTLCDFRPARLGECSGSLAHVGPARRGVLGSARPIFLVITPRAPASAPWPRQAPHPAGPVPPPPPLGSLSPCHWVSPGRPVTLSEDKVGSWKWPGTSRTRRLILLET